MCIFITECKIVEFAIFYCSWYLLCASFCWRFFSYVFIADVVWQRTFQLQLTHVFYMYYYFFHYLPHHFTLMWPLLFINVFLFFRLFVCPLVVFYLIVFARSLVIFVFKLQFYCLAFIHLTFGAQLCHLSKSASPQVM